MWVCFGLAYEAVRGVAGDDRTAAFANGRAILDAERSVHTLFEAHLERAVGRIGALSAATRAVYWISEFVLLVLALTWAYFANRGLYARFRDSVLVANVVGLLGYLLFPTAPPRLFGGAGFANRFSGQPPPEHAGGLIAFAANPYAAMPSIHAADALLIGVFLAAATASLAGRVLWSCWPAVVFFAVLATGNHFWLDVVAGIAVALVGLAVAGGIRRWIPPARSGRVVRACRRQPGCTARRDPTGCASTARRAGRSGSACRGRGPASVRRTPGRRASGGRRPS
jgi:hypothetical protein